MNINVSPEYKNIIIGGASDIYTVMRKVLDRENMIERAREHFWIVCLDDNNRLLNIELFALERRNIYKVKPTEPFKVAVLKEAPKIFMVHNKVDDRFTIAPFYVNFTDRLLQISKVLSIGIADHIVITSNGYISFKEEGMLENLKNSKKYVLKYEEEEQLRKEAMEIGEQQGKYEVAQKAVEMGYNNKEIKALTGLLSREIEDIRELSKYRKKL